MIILAVKNSTEICSTKDAHIRDGAAVTQFIYQLKSEVKNPTISAINNPATKDGGGLTEVWAADRLEVSAGKLQKKEDAFRIQKICGASGC